MPLSADFPKGFSDSEGCSLHVTIHLDPANLEAWFEAFRTPYEGCLSEKECTFFAVYQDPEQPGVVSWVEHW
jgi:quinol monooxygenase YgiN